MGKFVATFDGGVVADPESFEAGNSHGVRFPVYVNERRKNKATDEYEDTGNVAKIQVTVWNDDADQLDVRKGDIVEVQASLTERAYEGKNGPGRQLQTTFVDRVDVVYRRDDAPSAGSSPAQNEDPYGSELPW